MQTKNIKVSLPKLTENTDLKSSPLIVPKLKIHKRLGQSIEMVSHKIRTPKKVPITAIAF